MIKNLPTLPCFFLPVVAQFMRVHGKPLCLLAGAAKAVLETTSWKEFVMPPRNNSIQSRINTVTGAGRRIGRSNSRRYVTNRVRLGQAVEAFSSRQYAQTYGRRKSLGGKGG